MIAAPLDYGLDNARKYDANSMIAIVTTQQNICIMQGCSAVAARIHLTRVADT